MFDDISTRRKRRMLNRIPQLKMMKTKMPQNLDQFRPYQVQIQL